VHAEQQPGQVAAAAFLVGQTHDHRGAAGAAVGAGIGQEIAFALEAHAE